MERRPSVGSPAFRLAGFLAAVKHESQDRLCSNEEGTPLCLDLDGTMDG